ncbi:B3/4 domain-containing protein [Paenibacillus aurantiacus]|uniref:B3/4 domain-containing protein n=1 Tax=Paenibacillus aurantiacus TaxID=1936118 RepID=A0ABV5KLI1_9BACL
MEQLATDEKERNVDLFEVTFADDVLEMAPDLYVGLIAAPAVRNLERRSEVEALLAHMERELAGSGLRTDEISELATISAWRKAYSAFGAKPARYPCAAESLIRRVVEHGSLPRINTMVDLCNAISLKSRTPIACCDISQVDRFTIRKAGGSEPYLPIGKPDQPEYPAEGEVIYADGMNRAHSRRWNWRQSDTIKATGESRRLLFTVEAVHKDAKALVEATTSLLLELLQPFTDEGTLSVAFIHAEARMQRLSLHRTGGAMTHDGCPTELGASEERTG